MFCFVVSEMQSLWSQTTPYDTRDECVPVESIGAYVRVQQFRACFLSQGYTVLQQYTEFFMLYHVPFLSCCALDTIKYFNAVPGIS